MFNILDRISGKQRQAPQVYTQVFESHLSGVRHLTPEQSEVFDQYNDNPSLRIKQNGSLAKEDIDKKGVSSFQEEYNGYKERHENPDYFKFVHEIAERSQKDSNNLMNSMELIISVNFDSDSDPQNLTNILDTIDREFENIDAKPYIVIYNHSYHIPSNDVLNKMKEFDTRDDVFVFSRMLNPGSGDVDIESLIEDVCGEIAYIANAQDPTLLKIDGNLPFAEDDHASFSLWKLYKDLSIDQSNQFMPMPNDYLSLVSYIADKTYNKLAEKYEFLVPDLKKASAEIYRLSGLFAIGGSSRTDYDVSIELISRANGYFNNELELIPLDTEMNEFKKLLDDYRGLIEKDGEPNSNHAWQTFLDYLFEYCKFLSEESKFMLQLTRGTKSQQQNLNPAALLKRLNPK